MKVYFIRGVDKYGLPWVTLKKKLSRWIVPEELFLRRKIRELSTMKRGWGLGRVCNRAVLLRYLMPLIEVIEEIFGLREIEHCEAPPI